MTRPREKTPGQMRDELVRLAYAKAKDPNATLAQLNSALKSIADIAKQNPEPEPEPDRYVADEVGTIGSLNAARRLAILEEWRSKFVREIEKIDRARTALEHEREAA